jgi:hypothetical protein
MRVTSPLPSTAGHLRLALRRAAVLLGLAACAAARAAEPGATFTEFSFQDPSHGDLGGAFHLTVQPRSRLVLDLGLDAREHRGGGVGMASLGAGWRMELPESTRIVVGASANAIVGDFGPDDEPGGMSGVETGVAMNIDMARRLTQRLELVGRLTLATMDRCRVVTGLGARFYVSKRLAVGADWLHDDFSERFGVGLRFDFSRMR